MAFLRAAYGTGKKATATDLVTASAASIAAIMQAMAKQGDTFAREVRALEGLPADGLVRSGRARAGSEAPGLVDPTWLGPPPARAGRPAQPASPLVASARRTEAARTGPPFALDALRARLPASLLPEAFVDEAFDAAPPEPDDDDVNETAMLASALDSLGSPGSGELAGAVPHEAGRPGRYRHQGRL